MKIKKFFLFIFVIFLFRVIWYSPFNTLVNSSQTSVTARVQGVTVAFAGYASPYASVVLSSNNVYMRTTTSDQYGNFSFQDVQVQKTNNSNLCLETIDFQRIGDSKACLNLNLNDNNKLIQKDILLPPTIGLQRTEIAYNGEAVVFGYSMPGARVDLHISNGQIIKVNANNTGYYEFKVKHLAPGGYDLYAKSVYQGRASLKPVNKVHLVALTFWEQFFNYLGKLWNQFIQLFTSTSFGILWLTIPILILIIILIVKIWPEKFKFISGKSLRDKFQRFRMRNQLHHAWFVGY